MIHFVVPGALSTRTGGFVYDRRILEQLERRGRRVAAWELSGPSPGLAERARLRTLSHDDVAVIDGLALPALADDLPDLPPRCLALVHHPTALEPRVENREAVVAREAQALQAVAGIITTSAHTAHQLAAFGVSPAAVEVVHPATDPVPLTPAERAPGPLRLVCVATLTHRKGHDLLLDALAGLDVPWTLELLGGDRYEPDWARSILRRVDAWDGPGAIRWRGEIGDAERQAALSQADLFVLASRYEGFGIAPVEAVRAGVPVLTTRVGALPEALPAAAAELVDLNVEALRRGLAHCCAPERLVVLRRGARAHAATLPTWVDAGARFDAALTRLGVLPR